MFGSGAITLIILNEETNDIMKIVKFLEESSFLIKVIGETIENEAKKRKGGFLSMLLGTLGASLSGNLLIDKALIRAGEGAIRTGQNY